VPPGRSPRDDAAASPGEATSHNALIGGYPHPLFLPLIVAYDTFLNVMQFGDSRSLTTMTPTRRIQSSGGGGVGVHIADPRRESVTMFVDDHAQVFRASGLTYTFDRVATRSAHLITDLAAGDYYVTASSTGAKGVTIAVSKSPAGQRVTAVAGTVAFDVDGLQIVPAPAQPREESGKLAATP
jgi:hypothetical protein